MSENRKEFQDALNNAIDLEIFIDWMKTKYTVPKEITRSLIISVGISLPDIYDELRKLGYPMPAKEK